MSDHKKRNERKKARAAKRRVEDFAGSALCPGCNRGRGDHSLTCKLYPPELEPEEQDFLHDQFEWLCAGNVRALSEVD